MVQDFCTVLYTFVWHFAITYKIIFNFSSSSIISIIPYCVAKLLFICFDCKVLVWWIRHKHIHLLFLLILRYKISNTPYKPVSIPNSALDWWWLWLLLKGESYQNQAASVSVISCNLAQNFHRWELLDNSLDRNLHSCVGPQLWGEFCSSDYTLWNEMHLRQPLRSSLLLTRRGEQHAWNQEEHKHEGNHGSLWSSRGAEVNSEEEEARSSALQWNTQHEVRPVTVSLQRLQHSGSAVCSALVFPHSPEPSAYESTETHPRKHTHRPAKSKYPSLHVFPNPEWIYSTLKSVTRTYPS